MKQIICLLSLTLMTNLLSAQSHDNTVQREAMQKLAFMEGNWSGIAHMMIRGQGKQQIDQTEEVRYELGGTIMVIEGHGTSQGEDPKTVHHAFAVISYDETSESYSFKSWLENGRTGDYKARFDEEGNFIWIMETAKSKVRYKVKLDDEGNWVETGAWSADGTQWTAFFSMVLKKD